MHVNLFLLRLRMPLALFTLTKEVVMKLTQIVFSLVVVAFISPLFAFANDTNKDMSADQTKVQKMAPSAHEKKIIKKHRRAQRVNKGIPEEQVPKRTFPQDEVVPTPESK